MSSKNRVFIPAPPSLPLATDQYERRYQDQFTNILRLYFNQLQNSLAELFSNLKHVSFSSFFVVLASSVYCFCSMFFLFRLCACQ